MRILEALIIVLTAQITLAVLIMGPRRPRASNLLPLLPAALVVTNLILGGGRWQMLPASLVVAGLCALGIARFALPPRDASPAGRVIARIAAGAAFLAVMASAAAAILLPV